jgi:hypothetical protein
LPKPVEFSPAKNARFAKIITATLFVLCEFFGDQGFIINSPLCISIGHLNLNVPSLDVEIFKKPIPPGNNFFSIPRSGNTTVLAWPASSFA